MYLPLLLTAFLLPRESAGFKCGCGWVPLGCGRVFPTNVLGDGDSAREIGRMEEGQGSRGAPHLSLSLLPLLPLSLSLSLSFLLPLLLRLTKRKSARSH